MPKSERDGDVYEMLVFPMKHEEGSIQGICSELPVGPAEIHFVEEAALPIS